MVFGCHHCPTENHHGERVMGQVGLFSRTLLVGRRHIFFPRPDNFPFHL